METAWWQVPLIRTGLEFLAIVLLVLLNGLFAFSEIAVVSAKKVRLQQMVKAHKGAQVAIELAENPTNFLSTVQVGITLIGIFAGALSGATLAEEVAVWLGKLPLVGAHAEWLSLLLVVLLVTYLSLTIGELVPKAIALNNPEQGAASVARPLKLLSIVALPLVRILSSTTNAVLKLLRLEQTESLPVTEEELKALVAEGAAAGVFEPSERRLVEQALDLDDMSLRPLVTHRVHVNWIDLADTPAEILQTIAAHEHTWFPLCNGGLDHTLGIVRARDVLLLLAEMERKSGRTAASDKPEARDDTAASEKLEERDGIEESDGQHLRTSMKNMLSSIAYPPLFVPLATTPVRVLEIFRANHAHVAFAIDEYGGVEGIITPFDILETLVGELEGDGGHHQLEHGQTP
ncbi:MAG: hemolysin family protein [Caldilineaceae bacterium]